jgi:cytochrome c556
MRRFAVLAAVLAGSLAMGAAAEEPQKGEAGEGRLPAAARVLLLERMGNHRVDMARLHAAVLFLEHEAAEALARSIAAEPRLAAPTHGADAQLNSLVPPRFFELQDELRKKALQLAMAAEKEDDAAIAKAYGSLTETCVRCHATFLNEKN